MAKKRKSSKKSRKSRKKPTIVKVISADEFISEIPASIQKIGYTQRKLNILLGNLLFFIILFVFSAILYSITSIEFYDTLFFLLALVFGALSIALLIVLLIFVFLKILK